MENQRNRVCPVELANSLDGRFRRWLQNPQKILSPYVKEGMTVLDIGCGPGFFSVELATLVGSHGKVVSADLQDGMLEKLHNKIRGTELEERFRLVKCDQDKINISEKVDFGLAFFMVHEVPNKELFFTQLKTILNGDGQFLVVEPRLFHVSQKEFVCTTKIAEGTGFAIHPGPRLPLCWSAILKHA
jgi:ubiquinone/menaquinone biosynthesis C-methylase UbiE